MTDHPHPPFKDLLKSIPGFFGIRLEEEPAFDVVETIGDVEIRRYQPALLAQVNVGGEHDEAMNVAFKKLAGYVFGDNDRDQQSEMTTPVQQAQAHDHASPSTPVVRNDADGSWNVTFFLSNQLAAADAPQPNDAAVTLVEQPARLIASLRYTGNNTPESRADSRTRLLKELSTHPNFRVVDDVSWALYDQPFSIPFLKRNEAHVEVAEKRV